MADVTLWQKRLYPVLLPFGGIYGLGMRLRRAWLERVVAPLPCPCVSVGNIAWGGTGKTPIVEWLMRWSHERGVKSIVLSRGYKAHVSHPPVQVNAGHEAGEVGDEPLMLALAQPDIPVLVDPRRRRAARYALEHLSPELFILDDGFQHLAMRRDIDLVLLRPDDLEQDWNRVIPSGPWREPSTALKRAGAFLLRLTPEEAQGSNPALNRRIFERLAGHGKPVFSFYLEPDCLQHINTGATLDKGDARGKPYALITGIGHPEQARRTVSAFMGREPEVFIPCPDHHAFTEKDLAGIAHNDRMIICTAKDAVKIRALLPLQAHIARNIWCIRTHVRFGASWWAESFPAWWDAWWQGRQNAPRA